MPVARSGLQALNEHLSLTASNLREALRQAGCRVTAVEREFNSPADSKAPVNPVKARRFGMLAPDPLLMPAILLQSFRKDNGAPKFSSVARVLLLTTTVSDSSREEVTRLLEQVLAKHGSPRRVSPEMIGFHGPFAFGSMTLPDRRRSSANPALSVVMPVELKEMPAACILNAVGLSHLVQQVPEDAPSARRSAPAARGKTPVKGRASTGAARPARRG